VIFQENYMASSPTLTVKRAGKENLYLQFARGAKLGEVLQTGGIRPDEGTLRVNGENVSGTYVLNDDVTVTYTPRVAGAR
jgi:hypothetical protein